MDFGFKPEPLIEYATLAQRRRDWPEAERRWASIHELFPRNTEAYIGLAVALREQQRFDKAEALFAGAMEAFPDEPPRAILKYAALAHHRRDWAEAAQRWEVVRTRFPDRADGFRRGAAALACTRRHAEAEALELDANRRFAVKSG